MSKITEKHVVFEANPLSLELHQSKKKMTVKEFVDYIENKRRVSKFLVEDLRKMSPSERGIYLERLDLSCLFIRIENGKAFYDEYELNRLR